MKKIKELLKEHWFANTFALCSGIILCYILVNIGHIFEAIKNFIGFFSPIYTGLIIAYFINPLVNIFDKKIFKKIKKEKFKHTLSVITSIAMILIGFILLVVAFIPSFIDSVETFVNNLDQYIVTSKIYLQDITNVLTKLNIDVSEISTKLTETVQNLLTSIPEKISLILDKSYNIGLSIANAVISFILAIYFLLGKEKLKKDVSKLETFIKDKEKLEKHKNFLKRSNDILIRYIGYDIVDALIVGFVNSILMLIFEMPYVALVSIIVGITNLLPTFGPIIGGALGFLILLLNNPVQAFIFLVITIVLQTIDGYILKPKMFGNAFDVPAVWTLMAIITGGKMFGIVGIFLAIPIAAVISFTYKEIFVIWYNNNKKSKKEP